VEDWLLVSNKRLEDITLLILLTLFVNYPLHYINSLVYDLGRVFRPNNILRLYAPIARNFR
jgi:hypothetical protein